MPKRAGRDVMVGTFATLALLILAVAVMAVGGEAQVFARGASFRVTFPTTDGLRIGSPVKVAGVQVGSVRGIRLPTDPRGAGIEVHLAVERSYAPRIREDSKASLRYLQVLSGEKYVDVTPGSPSVAELAEGSEIRLSDQPEFFEQGADIAGNLNEITLSLRNILAPLERGEGLLGEMLHDPNFGKEGLAQLRDTIGNVEALTRQMREGEGFVGRLLFDREMAQRADRFFGSLDRFTTVLDSLSRREGAVGDLLADEGSSRKALEDIREAAASLRRTAERLESTEGLAGKILNDRDYSEKVARDLESLVGHLAAIAEKVDGGEGTLGLLINEREVHDGLEQVIAGVNDSKFARWLLRHYRKKGIKAGSAESDAQGKSP